ncbi:MAG TPA: hypothetical protein VHO84_16130, partial [Syntrophorhabdaceae bacterium]|nr:hypothetical protein [Syntrophorhabdaceae bacterium]
MRIRTYSFDDIKKGMEAIKQQYGPDTIIMDVKHNKLNDQGQTRKGCEISIGVEDQSSSMQDDCLLEMRRGTEAVWQYTTKYLGERLNSIEREMIGDRMKSYPISLKVLFEKMVRNGLDTYSALELVSEVYAEVGSLTEDSTSTLYFLKNAVAKRMKTCSMTKTAEPLMILGPSGSGKTDSAKKLAKICTDLRLPVSIISYDPARRSGCGDLLDYSESTGIPFHFTTDLEELSTKIKTMTGKIIIDTSGQIEVQKRAAAKFAGMKTAVVLPAANKDEKSLHYLGLFGHCN